MVSLKDFLEVIDYKITDGARYMWSCYGPDAYAMHHWNDINGPGGFELNVIFDTRTHKVYAVEASDYTNNRAYRLIDSAYRDSHKQEAQSRNCDYKQAWDDVNYIDLDLDFDWLDKARAIVAGTSYDERVSIEIDLTDQEMLLIFRLAHEKDMTFNQYVEYILRLQLDRLQTTDISDHD